MTGATAGIGLAAAAQMQQNSDVRLLIGARVKTLIGAHVLSLDLARLASVRSFAAAVAERLGETEIDVLVLNAGVSFGNTDQRTEGGFETTFAVNHLVHYLLRRLLMPRLAASAVVLITTSDAHDPKTVPFVSPEHADARKLAHGQVRLSPTAKPGGMRAYPGSKLCNVPTAQALATSAFAKARGLGVIAFDPGATPATQLGRSHTRIVKILITVLVPVLGLFRQLNTVEGGGEILAGLALGRIVPPVGRVYASEVKRRLTWPDPSELARDDIVMAKARRDSAALVGLADQR